MIRIRIIAGREGVGQEFTYPSNAVPPAIRARLASGTATIVEDDRAETTMLEPRSSAAVTAAQNPPARDLGGRFSRRR